MKLLLLEHQKEYVHFSDGIFAREKHSVFVPIDEGKATVITPEESRAFLAGIGIAGELVPTKSHSADGAAPVLDDGNAFVGDLEPREYIAGYDEGEALRRDWNLILSKGAEAIYYGHANMQSKPRACFGMI